MNKHELIIKTVQNISEIEDITDSNRMRYVADCRHVCYGLAKKYLGKRYNGYIMSKYMKRTHASGINSIKSFENNINKSWFEANDVFNESVEVLNDIFGVKNKEIQKEIDRLDDKREFLMSQINVNHNLVTP